MQDPPEKIPELVKNGRMALILSLVVEIRERIFYNEINKKIFYIVLKKFSKNNIPLNVSDFQLVDRQIVNKFMKLRDNLPFIRTLAFEYSDNFDTINYTWKKRIHGRSKESLKDYVDSAMNGLISVSDAPFRLIIIAGFIVSAFSLTYGMYA